MPGDPSGLRPIPRRGDVNVGIIWDHTAKEARRREVGEVGPRGADRQCSRVETTLIDHFVLGYVHAVEEQPVRAAKRPRRRAGGQRTRSGEQTRRQLSPCSVLAVWVRCGGCVGCASCHPDSVPKSAESQLCSSTGPPIGDRGPGLPADVAHLPPDGDQGPGLEAPQARRAQDSWSARTSSSSSGAGPSTTAPGTTSRIGSARTGDSGIPHSARHRASCAELAA